MNSIKILAPGVVLTFFIALFSRYLSCVLSTWVNIESLTIGIALSMILAAFIKIPERLEPGVKFSLKKLLKCGIVLLGFRMNYAVIMTLGPGVLVLVCLLSPVIILTSWFLGKKLKVPTHLSVLIGVGSSICGASAVVTIASCINSDDDDVILTVTIISFLGAVGVIAYTFISAISPMSDVQFGLWSGASLQGVAHAIAAAFARGEVSGEAGTLIKMARVLMLVPVSMVLSSIFSDKSSGKKAPFPTYVLFFILAGVVGSIGILPAEVNYFLGKLSSWFILMAMVGMGFSVDFGKIKSRGGRALFLGLILFTTLSVSLYLIISTFF